jgi:threonine aldolase
LAEIKTQARAGRDLPPWTARDSMDNASMIDLFSDTRTEPTPAMRRAMAEAAVGDEQAGLDPTVNALCERVADLLGKQAAVYLPSGTMCNEISYRVHCRPGDEIILDRTAHGITAEAGGPAALAGAMVHPLDGEHGRFTVDQVRGALRSGSRYEPRSRVVSVEQTSNFGGGAVWPVARMEEVCDLAHRHGLATHMDGARLMNAVVAGGEAADRHAAPFDSVWLDFSKGLGAPVGAVLAGSSGFIDEAWRLKQQMGGAMRQAGIIAAAGLYALDHHVDRLADDHTNARRLAEGLAEIPGVVLDPRQVETNLVFFDLAPAAPEAARVEQDLADRGVRIGAMGPRRMRAVTHLGVDRDDIEVALKAVAAVLT